MTPRLDPLAPFLARQGVVVLDGGLATELERRGHDLSDALWSARLLLDDPEAIVAVHRSYLEAGADCITAATYQATVAGFARRGLGEAAAEAAIVSAVDLAYRARDAFWADPTRHAGRLRPLVAASVGPYGAFRADGSEYTGAYDLDEEGLAVFHARRLALLAAAGADLLAVESLPSAIEARALVRLLDAGPRMPAWLSFTCRDGATLSDGTPIAAVAAEAAASDRVVAIGVNCTAPRHVPSLIPALAAASDRPIVVYPNSGERWDARAKRWRGRTDTAEFAAAARAWHAAGARLIGGCCRTGPEHVRRLRAALLDAAA